MKLNKISTHLKKALASDSAELSTHIKRRAAENRADGIEAAFSASFHSTLSADSYRVEVPLNTLGLKQRYSGRTDGRLDCLIEGDTGIEYKAVRLPRLRSSPLYDLGQLVADHQRLDNPRVLDASYLIVLLHGPLVADAGSGGSLYRAFHNQMFIDFMLMSRSERAGKASSWRKLGFTSPWRNSQAPKNVISVKKDDIGVVAIAVLQ